jgi:hypothetical protein
VSEGREEQGEGMEVEREDSDNDEYFKGTVGASGNKRERISW